MLSVVLLLVAISRSTGSHADGWRALWHPASAWAGTLLSALTFDDPPAGLLRGDTAVLQDHILHPIP